MRQITDDMRKTAQKYITPDWWNRYAWLEPYDIDEEKIQNTASGVYVKCICHYPDCPTMKNKEHPWASIRTSKLNRRTQISCGACAKKARNDIDHPELMYKKMKVGDIIGCWELLEEVSDNELKTKMEWTGHSKYYKARCIYCGAIDYKNSDHLKVGDNSCNCQTGSLNERKISKILTSLKTKYSFNFENEYGLSNLRVDFAIKDKNTNNPICFIEYDGEFHDVAEICENGLKITKERDERKNKIVTNMNIPLIRIHHSEQALITEEWIEEKIKKYLVKL